MGEKGQGMIIPEKTGFIKDKLPIMETIGGGTPRIPTKKGHG